MPKPTVVLVHGAAENTDALLLRGQCAIEERDGRFYTEAAFAHLPANFN